MALKRNGHGTLYEEIDGEIVAKECKDCSTVFSLADFYRLKSGLAGRASYCKTCAKARSAKSIKKQYEKNPGKFKERTMKWREENKDKDNAYRLTYYKEYRKKNPEKIQSYCKAYRERHPGRNALSCKKFVINHTETRRVGLRRYYVENRETVLEKTKIWRRENPDKVTLYSNNRRARKKALPDDMTAKDLEFIENCFGGNCALTGDSEVHLDHFIPIKIGHGGTTLANMIPLRADLNQSKSAQNPFEWFAETKERFGIEQCKFDEVIGYLADLNGMTPTEYRDYVYECFANPIRTIDEAKEVGTI